MGAWGYGSLENDTASDWLYELEHADGFSTIDAKLDEVMSMGDDYLDSDVAQEALAAVEALAYVQRGKGSPMTPSFAIITSWAEKVSSVVPDELKHKALAAVERITQQPSELLSLYQEAESESEWRAEIESLKARLNG